VVEFAALLPELSGPPELLTRAIARAPSRPAGIRRALQQLAELLAELRRHPVPARLHVDLSEVRGFDYYTGMRVQGYVHGAAEAVLQGGRYDDLLARYGRSSPAVGFAIDVEATAGALEQLAEQRNPGPPGSRSTNGVGNVGGNGIGHGPPATVGCWSAGPWDDALAAAQALRRNGRRGGGGTRRPGRRSVAGLMPGAGTSTK
jgi:ATP phosphoribosyltransferase regulatory subunit